MLQLFNTLHRKKEPFQPLIAGKVGLYVCGITVYDHCHVGHARVMVVYDVLYRHLLASGLDVKYVRNITDVDDKIINRAAENGVTPDEISARFILAMEEDEASLGVLRPTHEPRATQAVDSMLALIQRLIDSGYAYAAENGDVFYAVRKFADYGKLSGRRLDELEAGTRVAIDEFKRDPLDFVLWKSAKPGEPSWPSPWGDGRPGWHIECSAMAGDLLGDEFDIHGGGMDLEFPHHENEIAQSEAATGKSFAQYWMHNGLVRIDDEKMSKSLNNFFTIRDVLKSYSGEEIRYFIMASHYRSPLNYATGQLDAARSALRRFYTALRGQDVVADAPIDEPYLQRFEAAMDDDLNTPEAIAILHELAGELNRLTKNGKKVTDSGERSAQLAHTLRALGGRLGLLQAEPEAVLQAGHNDALDSAAIEVLISERVAARADKDWARSDEIRDQLVEAGVVLEDAGGVTTWRRA
ncbi:MAG: cysteine--tRNA ligase [Granulosicoccus sp.]